MIRTNTGRDEKTVGIPLHAVQRLANAFGAENQFIGDLATGEILISQTFDQDGDGKADQYLHGFENARALAFIYYC